MIVIEPRFSIDSTSQQSRDNRSEAKQRNVTILFHLRDLREAIRSRVSLYILLFPEIGGEWECETMDDLLSNKIVVDKKKRIVFNYRISNEHTGKNVQRIDGGGRGSSKIHLRDRRFLSRKRKHFGALEMISDSSSSTTHLEEKFIC